jgi:hypothetical protein
MKYTFRTSIFVTATLVVMTVFLGIGIAQAILKKPSVEYRKDRNYTELVPNVDYSPNEILFLSEKPVRLDAAQIKQIQKDLNVQLTPQVVSYPLRGEGSVCGKHLIRVVFETAINPYEIDVKKLENSIRKLKNLPFVTLDNLSYIEPDGWGHPGTDMMYKGAKNKDQTSRNAASNDVTVFVLDTGYGKAQNNPTSPGLLLDKDDKRRMQKVILTKKDYQRSRSSMNGFDDFKYVQGKITLEGHGTFVSELIKGATTKNWKICSRIGFCTTISMLDGICAAQAAKPDVINLSVASRFQSTMIYGAIQDAINSGITVVTASGNSGAVGNYLMFSAGWSNGTAVADGLIAVAGVTMDKEPVKTKSSTCQPYTDVSAYGENIATSKKGYLASGTSFAAAQVSSVAAREIAANSKLRNKPVDVEKALIEIAKRNLLSDSKCMYLGHGLIK